MKSSLLLFLLLAVTLQVYSQHDSGYNKGNIILSEGSQLDGLIRYESGSEVEFSTCGLEQSFSSSELEQFSFFDSQKNKWRTFVILEVHEHKVHPEILEVLGQGENFAFLMQKNVGKQEIPINPSRHGKGRYVPRNIARTYGTKTEIRTEETFYMLSHKGGLKPYVQFIERDGRTDVRYLDKQLLEDLAGSGMNDELGYENKKEFKPKASSDLIRIINNFSNIYQALPGDGKVLRSL